MCTWIGVYPTKLAYNLDGGERCLEKFLLRRAVMMCQKGRMKCDVLRPPSLQTGGKTVREGRGCDQGRQL